MKHKIISVFLFLFTSFLCAAEDIPQIKFLDETEAKKEIVNDSLAPYFNQLQPMEMSAKTGSQIAGTTLDEMRAECRLRYQNAAKSFSAEEQEEIKKLITEINPSLKKDYPKFAALSWSFLKVSDNIEGGLPHTRDHHIILSEGICKNIISSPNKLFFIELFIHEQFHVFQRLNPGFFSSLYKNIWGLEKADKINGCDWLVVHHLANPDALDCTWILPVKKDSDTTYILPLVVFSDGESLKKMPKDFQMLGITLTKSPDGFNMQPQPDKDGKPVSQNLLAVKEYRDAFLSLSTNIYHPEEASADIFAKTIMMDYLYSSGKIPQANYDKIEKLIGNLRSWLKENMKTEQKK